MLAIFPVLYIEFFYLAYFISCSLYCLTPLYLAPLPTFFPMGPLVSSL